MSDPYVTKNYSALIDSSSGAILTISTNISTLAFLNECTPDTGVAISINYPNYEGFFSKLFFLASIDPKDYPKWTWNREKRKLVKTKDAMLSSQLFEKSSLAEAKHGIISKMMFDLNSARFRIKTGIEFQEMVYIEKKMQAQAFKDSGYNEDSIMKYPYVIQYADCANVSLKQAAEDILLKAKFDDDVLAKTELLRLKYFNKVKKATKLNQLSDMYREFFRDCYINARV